MKRTCKKCGLDSDDLTRFMPHKTAKHGRKNLCNRCNKQRVAARNRAIIDECLKQPCADCGNEFHPCIMQFDHARGKKERCVPQMVHKGLKAVLAEIAKCDVVCANCHCLRTFRRRDASTKDAE